MFMQMAVEANINLQLVPAVLSIALVGKLYIMSADLSLPIAALPNPKLSTSMSLQNTVLGHLILKLVLQVAHLI
ncbi:hypothetical protein HMPREF2608_05715 [Neisseria sp. HMSC064D07]|nr:hypothetical protein HMPREF2608_05715 [Neisseria sp. HMSC064D07]